jgi:hypothetical protein
MKTGIVLLMVIMSVPIGRAANTEELFRAKESNLSLFGVYVDKAKDKWGGGVGLSYFLSTYVGLGAVTHFENFSGKFFDNVAGELYLRAPLAKLPIAPYAVGGGGYSWDNKDWFESAGGGIELRTKKSFGIFADVQWYWRENARDGLQARGGLRFSY